MTTIAADALAGMMCSDACVTDGIDLSRMRKVYRVRGELLGFCGDLGAWTVWLAEWRAGELRKSLKRDQVNVLRLSRSGLSTWDSVNGWCALQNTRYAIGTGGHAARGAMAIRGVTLQQAVRAACTIDPGSRGPVRTYRL